MKADSNGWPYFIDGWGRPIAWLRWAPGCSANYNANLTVFGVSGNFVGFSDIQSGNYLTDHDPFDPRNLQAVAPVNPASPTPAEVSQEAYRLIPLVLSGGRPNDHRGQPVNRRDANRGQLRRARLGQPDPVPDLADGESV